MQSHLDADRLTSLIDSGKIAGADLEQALKDRGCIYEFLAGDTLAIADYSRAIAIDPNDAEAYFVRGRTFANSFKYTQAIVDYSMAIRLTPDDAEAYYRRGNAYENGPREHARAVADYDASIHLDPNHPAVYHARAIAYEHLGRNSDAAADEITARRVSPSPSNAIAVKRAADEWD